MGMIERLADSGFGRRAFNPVRGRLSSPGERAVWKAATEPEQAAIRRVWARMYLELIGSMGVIAAVSIAGDPGGLWAWAFAPVALIAGVTIAVLSWRRSLRITRPIEDRLRGEPGFTGHHRVRRLP